MDEQKNTHATGGEPFAAPDRGKRALTGSGEVHGSGVGTGGNAGEDYDQDAQASGGTDPLQDIEADESRENRGDRLQGQYGH